MTDSHLSRNCGGEGGAPGEKAKIGMKVGRIRKSPGLGMRQLWDIRLYDHGKTRSNMSVSTCPSINLTLLRTILFPSSLIVNV